MPVYSPGVIASVGGEANKVLRLLAMKNDSALASAGELERARRDDP